MRPFPAGARAAHRRRIFFPSARHAAASVHPAQHDAVDARMAAVAPDQFEQGIARPAPSSPRPFSCSHSPEVSTYTEFSASHQLQSGRPDVHGLLQAIVFSQQETFAAFADQRGFAAARRPNDEEPWLFADITARQAVFETLPGCAASTCRRIARCARRRKT